MRNIDTRPRTTNNNNRLGRCLSHFCGLNVQTTLPLGTKEEEGKSGDIRRIGHLYFPAFLFLSSHSKKLEIIKVPDYQSSREFEFARV
jgi:hypothetical protein